MTFPKKTDAETLRDEINETESGIIAENIE